MSKKHYFNHQTLNRSSREYYITDKKDIRKIIFWLLKKIPALCDYIWIDPCAGDGRWEEVAQEFGIKVYSYDIEPQSDFVEKADFFSKNWQEVEYNNVKPLFFIGNPPFSKVKKFVEHALKYADFCYFLGGPLLITNTLGNKVLILHRFEGYEGNQKDRRTKLRFIDSNGEEIKVWTVGALFGKSSGSLEKFHNIPQSTIFTFKIYPHKNVIEDYRVRVIKRVEDEDSCN